MKYTIRHLARLLDKYKATEVNGKFITYNRQGKAVVECALEGGKITWRITKDGRKELREEEVR